MAAGAGVAALEEVVGEEGDVGADAALGKGDGFAGVGGSGKEREGGDGGEGERAEVKVGNHWERRGCVERAGAEREVRAAQKRKNGSTELIAEVNFGTMKPVVLVSDYSAFLTEVKGRIQSARLSAGRAVNRELVMLYWELGRGILEKQAAVGWGESVVERLSADLRAEFPDMRGFSANNLWLMRQFYAENAADGFLEQAVREMKSMAPARLEQAAPEANQSGASRPNAAILEQLVQEFLAPIPWGHHVEILKKAKDPRARLYYLKATAKFGWSRAVLLNQIKAQAYERAKAEKKTHNFAAALPEHFAEQADEMLKSRYNLEFLGIARPMKERELEERLIGRLQQFILELGYGFCFVGRQYRLALGAKEYFVDLLFYHRFLKALVAFDLKVVAFEPEFAGKMDFYLNLLNEKERAPDDRPSIGIILCAEKDDVEVEFALKSKGNPIGVAEYLMQSKLPAEFKGKLPTAKQLADVVREILPAKARPRG
jgi:predicted nuclease of restriction endonuclease-like (RecB) superfamily